jgi:hypothetical protein
LERAAESRVVRSGEEGFGQDNVLEPMFPNVGTSDYALISLRWVPRRTAYSLPCGGDSPRITQQYAEYGLNKRMPLFGIASFTSEEVLGKCP